MWRANVGDRFTFVTMVLEQRGDEISGTACGSAAGMVMFRNAPVRGEYPHVRFDVAATYVEPCCGALTGSRFAGRRDSSGDIVGQYNGRDVRFGRTSDPVCR